MNKQGNIILLAKCSASQSFRYSWNIHECTKALDRSNYYSKIKVFERKIYSLRPWKLLHLSFSVLPRNCSIYVLAYTIFTTLDSKPYPILLFTKKPHMTHKLHPLLWSWTPLHPVIHKKTKHVDPFPPLKQHPPSIFLDPVLELYATIFANEGSRILRIKILI